MTGRKRKIYKSMKRRAVLIGKVLKEGMEK